MALPLLLAAGAGILGGTQYLMKRQDQEVARNKFADFSSQLQSSSLAGTAAGDQLLAAGQSRIDNDSFWHRGKVSTQIDQAMTSLSNFNQAELLRGREALMQSQTAQRNAMLQANQQVSAQLQDDYSRDFKEFNNVQNLERAAVNALNSGDREGTLFAAFNIAKLLDPASVARESETGAIINSGGASNNLVNAILAFQGDAANPKTRQNLLEAIQQQTAPRYEDARARQKWYQGAINEYNQRGYDIISPIGSQNVREAPSYLLEGSTPQDSRAAIPIEKRPPPPGFTLTPPNQVNPGQRRKARRNR